MEYTNKQLYAIYKSIPEDDDAYTTVRGLLELFFVDKTIPKHIIQFSPSFCIFVENNSQKIYKVLHEQKVADKNLTINNKKILREVITQLKYKSAISNDLEHRIIKIDCLETPSIKHQGLTIQDIYVLIDSLCQETTIKTAVVRADIREGFGEFMIDETGDEHYHITFLLSSTGQLRGVIGRSLADSMFFHGADFILTDNLADIVKILENYGYRDCKDTIEESIGNILNEGDTSQDDEDDFDEGDDEYDG